MAYLRKENETVEMDYPLSKVWEAIQKAIHDLKWTVEEIKETEHQLKAKTKKSFMSYSSLFLINAEAIKENVTRVKISAETPVTTLTAIADFGKTKERLNMFLSALSNQLLPRSEANEEKA
jgi:23S rRNA A2030 N6-methylase RlmJ